MKRGARPIPPDPVRLAALRELADVVVRTLESMPPEELPAAGGADSPRLVHFWTLLHARWLRRVLGAESPE